MSCWLFVLVLLVVVLLELLFVEMLFEVFESTSIIMDMSVFVPMSSHTQPSLVSLQGFSESILISQLEATQAMNTSERRRMRVLENLEGCRLPYFA